MSDFPGRWIGVGRALRTSKDVKVPLWKGLGRVIED